MKIIRNAVLLLMLTFSIAAAQQVNSKAPLFSGKTMDGEDFNLAAYKGKVVLLDFWASWCGPCKKEFPFLKQLHEKVKNNGVEIITINVDTDAKKMLSFLQQTGGRPDFTVVMDPAGKLPEQYQVEGMPTTVLIDANGVIRYRHTGFTNADKDEIVKEIKALAQL